MGNRSARLPACRRFQEPGTRCSEADHLPRAPGGGVKNAPTSPIQQEWLGIRELMRTVVLADRDATRATDLVVARTLAERRNLIAPAVGVRASRDHVVAALGEVALYAGPQF